MKQLPEQNKEIAAFRRLAKEFPIELAVECDHWGPPLLGEQLRDAQAEFNAKLAEAAALIRKKDAECAAMLATVPDDLPQYAPFVLSTQALDRLKIVQYAMLVSIVNCPDEDKLRRRRLGVMSDAIFHATQLIEKEFVYIRDESFKRKPARKGSAKPRRRSSKKKAKR